jgi:hypothetical protein
MWMLPFRKTKMIVINLKGGVGNQMFQYATGRAIALTSAENGFDSNLKLSIHSYTANPLRSYGLSVYNIKASIADEVEISHIKYPFGILSKVWRFFAGRFLRFYMTVHYDESIIKPRKNIFLDGYFQSEKYFIKYRPLLLDDFTLLTPLSLSASKFENIIKQSSASVSLHIRRGDYVNHPYLSEVCTSYYYREASKLIKEKHPDAVFFIFSDDPGWASKNLVLPETHTIYVSDKKILDYEELYLMSMCSHNIIANSSFSWWGAWLNQNPDKIVIAPAMWTNQYKPEFKDIVPDSWIRINRD